LGSIFFFIEPESSTVLSIVLVNTSGQWAHTLQSEHCDI
jgi:hypothetical protein